MKFSPLLDDLIRICAFCLVLVPRALNVWRFSCLKARQKPRAGAGKKPVAGPDRDWSLPFVPHLYRK